MLPYKLPELLPSAKPAPAMEDKNWRLEENLRPSYKTWKADPSPENLAGLHETVQPIVRRALKTYLHGEPSPTLQSRAKIMTIQALHAYDPTKAQLNTHLFHHLQAIQRHAGREQRVLAIPEAQAIDVARMRRAEKELRDTLGHDPSDLDIADHTGMSVRRLAKLRRVPNATAEGKFSIPNEGGDIFDPRLDSPGSNRSAHAAWLEFVYHDLPSQDRIILEHSLGLHGRPKLSNVEIAKKLKLSAPAISQRRAKIQDLLDQRGEMDLF